MSENQEPWRIANLVWAGQYEHVPCVEFVEKLKILGESLRLTFPFHLIGGGDFLEASSTDDLDTLYIAFFNYLAIYGLTSRRAGEMGDISILKLCEIVVCVSLS